MDYVKLLQTIMGAEGEVTETSEFYESPTGVEIKLEQKLKR
jgi:hypothetical protein